MVRSRLYRKIRNRLFNVATQHSFCNILTSLEFFLFFSFEIYETKLTKKIKRSIAKFGKTHLRGAFEEVPDQRDVLVEHGVVQRREAEGRGRVRVRAGPQEAARGGRVPAADRHAEGAFAYFF